MKMFLIIVINFFNCKILKMEPSLLEITLAILYLVFLLNLCVVGAILIKMIRNGVFPCLNNTNEPVGPAASTSSTILPSSFQDGESAV